ncbi:MAG: autotransporter outer membrane beta-barrel domain-containing protein [Acidaminococcaceae bacterium]
MRKRNLEKVIVLGLLSGFISAYDLAPRLFSAGCVEASVIEGPYNFTEDSTVSAPPGYTFDSGSNTYSIIRSNGSLSTITSNDGVKVSVINNNTDTSDAKKWVYGVAAFNGGTVTLDDVKINGSMWTGLSAEGGNINVGDNLYIDIHQADGSKQSYGIRVDRYATGVASVSVGDNAYIRCTGDGVWVNSPNGSVTIGDNLTIDVSQSADNAGFFIKGGKVDVGDNANIKSTGQGVLAYSGANVTIGNNAAIDVDYKGAVAYGLKGLYALSGATITTGTNLTLTSDGYGLYSTGTGSKISVGDGAIISSDASYDDQSGYMAVLRAANGGNISLKGAAISMTNPSSNESAILVSSNGVVDGTGVYDISGNIGAMTGGAARLTMQDGSVFTGATNLLDTSSTIDLDLTGSVWNVTGNSATTNLVNNSSTINMTADTNQYSTLTAASYSGTGGSFVLDTDLASETDSDKVNITSSTAGTTYVQVKDTSLTTGTEVTGLKNLLLITDDSATATFTGKSLNSGGLWDVTPTVENGLNVKDVSGNIIGTADQWYLTKIAKVVNNDTSVLLKSADNEYALWRNTNDTLRKRLGELHYSTDRETDDDFWGRFIGGKFGGDGFTSRYNMYQFGYDKSVNDKSKFGVSIDTGTGRANYDLGTSKDEQTAVSMYGTWSGDDKSYTDLVARVGLFDSKVNSFGDYPDNGSYKSHAYSLSAEYGKNIELSKKNGTFIEPQAQFIAARLGDAAYKTDRGTQVNLAGMNSFIGRLGFVLGCKKSEDGNSAYFKGSVLHEFGGERDISMLAANNETLKETRDYGDTWVELGVGGNVKLSKVSHLYGDVERSFGADIDKKWQVNAGIRVEF